MVDPSLTVPTGIPEQVDELLLEALRAGASDLHLEPGPEGMRSRLRVDGVFLDHRPLARDGNGTVINRLKVMARLAVHRSDIPQEGRIPFRPAGQDREYELRISILPVVGGEKAVVRFFDMHGGILGLDALGFDEQVRRGLGSFLSSRDGLYLLCGPSGSGKTTTIYALLQELVRLRGDRMNVVSVEDPVERVLPGISQTQVNPGRGLDYAAVLKALMRQDPEVIAVGEIRDPETAQTVLRASFTGHLVVTTLHCGTVLEAVRRLTDLGLPVPMVTAALRGVLAQRLVRLICGECGGAGCGRCLGTGYKGRTAYGEYLDAGAEPVRRALTASMNGRELEEAAKQAGMRTLEEAGQLLVRTGRTRAEEIR